MKNTLLPSILFSGVSCVLFASQATEAAIVQIDLFDYFAHGGANPELCVSNDITGDGIDDITLLESRSRATGGLALLLFNNTLRFDASSTTVGAVTVRSEAPSPNRPNGINIIDRGTARGGPIRPFNGQPLNTLAEIIFQDAAINNGEITRGYLQLQIDSPNTDDLRSAMTRVIFDTERTTFGRRELDVAEVYPTFRTVSSHNGVVVPEPSAGLALGILGLAGLTARRRK